MTSQSVPDESGLSRGQVVVACHDVTKEYTRGSQGAMARFRGSQHPSVTALEEVSLEVNRGEVVGIAGPSGSGKSTLLHLMAGLDTPTNGRVFLAGQNITPDTDERELVSHRLDTVGVVFQRFHLLPALTARSNVALPLVQRGISKGGRRERAESLLDRVGLADRATHKPGELSGGEQQRVAIARALATEPELLIADEPTGELDTDTAERILDIFTDIARDRAVVIASHDEQTIAIADRVVQLHDGYTI
ncbi:MAG: ABC transporter ATP-binding protein [Halorhabdus sp.]